MKLFDITMAYDVYDAIHCYLSVNHEGQGSKKYELLSRSVFKPGPLWSETRMMLENPYYENVSLLSDEEIEQLMTKCEAML